MNFSLFFNIFAIVMTTFVSGMLIWLHFRLAELKSSAKQLPMLEESFAKSLMGARREMQTLEKFATEKLPGLDEKITAARQAIDEIDYMLTKTDKSMNSAEKLLTNIKEAAPTTAAIETPQAQTPTITPATANPSLPNLENTPQQTSPTQRATPKSIPMQQQAYSASAQLASPPTNNTEEKTPSYQSRKPQLARENDGTPTYASETISRAEMTARNKQSSAEQSLRDSLAEILK